MTVFIPGSYSVAGKGSVGRSCGQEKTTFDPGVIK